MDRGLCAITGASSGLGEVFARKLAASGQNLLLSARRADRLEALKSELEDAHGVSVETLACDLASEAGIEMLAALIENGPPLSILVNNAGFGTKDYFWEGDYSRQLAMARVHVLATMRLTRAALPAMVARRAGAIINVSSVAAYFRSSKNTTYCATKGWMNDFTEGLRLELDSIASPVAVQSLCPGFTYTEFHDTLGVNRDLIPKWLWMSSDFVVGESLKALSSRKLFVIPGWKYRLAATFAELLPVPLRLSLERSSPHKRK